MRRPSSALGGGRPTGSRSRARSGAGSPAAGVPVVSGLALGIDAAAHLGALDAGGPAVAVLAGGADVAYPAGTRRLHARVIAPAARVVSEMPPGFGAMRWCFPPATASSPRLADADGRRRGRRSAPGSLITADLPRTSAAPSPRCPVPSRPRLAAGTNALLHGRRAPSSATPATRSTSCSAPARPTLRRPRRPRAARRAARAACCEHGRARPRLGSRALAPRRGGAPAASRALTELELLGLVRRGVRRALCAVP